MPIIPNVNKRIPEKKDTVINIPVVPGMARSLNFANNA